MKNLFINFVNWYLETNEGKTSNYLANQCKGDREFFIANLSEYAVEFAIAYGYNPFLVNKENIISFISKLDKDIYRDGTPFARFSKNKDSDLPQALLGKNNYLAFLRGLNTAKATAESLKKPPVRNQPTDTYHYEKEEMKKIFTLRLITQDRYYEFLYYPISVLKKLFYHNERRQFFNNYIGEQRDNIVVYIGKSDKLLFKDVDTLDINNDGSVLINGKFKLHTNVTGNGAKEELSTNTIENIVIDHAPSLERVMFALKEQLPTLQIIHNTLTNINNGRISNKEDLKNAGNHLVRNVEFSPKELDNLEKDLNLILSKTQLQLMDRYENLYKKKYE
ncbi:MAG: hypothetical protein LBJ17_06340 [Dysgonamonadaceae bacterium]|jgi:hypothetical protein|nr:hypothetical protein [Dysgonamonadaceae bacterium]